MKQTQLLTHMRMVERLKTHSLRKKDSKFSKVSRPKKRQGLATTLMIMKLNFGSTRTAHMSMQLRVDMKDLKTLKDQKLKQSNTSLHSTNSRIELLSALKEENQSLSQHTLVLVRQLSLSMQSLYHYRESNESFTRLLLRLFQIRNTESFKKSLVMLV